MVMELQTIRWRGDRVKVIRLLPSGDDEKKGDKEEPDVNQSVHASLVVDIGVEELWRGGWGNASIAICQSATSSQISAPSSLRLVF